MVTKKNALELALAKGAVTTRPLEAIEAGQDETIRWAEDVARNFPVKVRRGRPAKSEPAPEPSRSVTVRFPPAQARIILAAAQSSGFTLSEFVRAAACQAATRPPQGKKGTPSKRG